jgi:hypothetical protein
MVCPVEVNGFIFVNEGLLPDGEKSGFKRRSATRRWKVSLMDVHKRKISYCVEGGKIFAKGLLPASLRFSLYAAPREDRRALGCAPGLPGGRRNPGAIAALPVQWLCYSRSILTCAATPAWSDGHSPPIILSLGSAPNSAMFRTLTSPKVRIRSMR